MNTQAIKTYQKEIGYLELLRCYLTQVPVCTVRTSEEAERIRTPHKATTAIVEHLRWYVGRLRAYCL